MPHATRLVLISAAVAGLSLAMVVLSESSSVAPDAGSAHAQTAALASCTTLDVTGDGTVDIDDVQLVFGRLGEAVPAYDFDGTGQVGFSDLIIQIRSQERCQPPAELSGGYLTTAGELAEIKRLADQGVEPHESNRDRLVSDADDSWEHGSVSGEFSANSGACFPLNDQNRDTDYILDGASDVYARALAFHLTGAVSYAEEARQHILDLTDTFGFQDGPDDYSGGNRCILQFGFSLTVWIQSADLLEGTSVWSAADRTAFQDWLASEVYDLVAWASRERENNWGAAGSASAAALADYVSDRDDIVLREVDPIVTALTPAQAFAVHTNQQRLRMTSGDPWEFSDSSCFDRDEVRGIQPHGGIPDELRRGSTGCTGSFLERTDDSYRYSHTHIRYLVTSAELLRRRGDTSLINLSLADGTPAILAAILFVIDNPTPGGNSFEWRDSRRSTLYVASRLYDDPRLLAARDGGSFRGGQLLPYAIVTHQ